MIESNDTNLILPQNAMPSQAQLKNLENLPSRFSSDLGLTYHLNAAKYFVANLNFDDKNVLEVGGALPAELVQEQLNVRQWISVNLYSWNDGEMPDDCISSENATANLLDSAVYQCLNGSAESLPKSFENRFDIVCSINAFEHIHNIWGALDTIYDALLPGGILIATFGPIWSGSIGHHAFIDQSLNFGTFNIPPYTHLRYSKLECRNILLEEYGPAIADRFMYEAFFSPVINRLFVEDYIDALASSRFRYWRVEPWGVEAEEEVLKELEPTVGRRLMAEGINLIAQR